MSPRPTVREPGRLISAREGTLSRERLLAACHVLLNQSPAAPSAGADEPRAAGAPLREPALR